MRPKESGIIRRNVDVIAMAVLLAGMALCSNTRLIVLPDFFGDRRIVLDRAPGGHFTLVSCPLSPSLVLR